MTVIATIIAWLLTKLISRAEVTAMLFTFADINANVERIVRVLEGEDGEQETPEEDT